MTFALAAWCLETRRYGYAVATSSVCVGARCGAVSAHGVVFSQARTDPRLHAVGLAALDAGADAAAAVAAMAGAATAPHWRQFGALTARGAAHRTGASCLPESGGVTGKSCLALGNYLGSPEVLPAIIAGFESASGPLESRLLAGMLAGEAAGSEIDPLQSAALFTPGPAGIPEADLRIDRSHDPLAELLALWQDWAPKASAYRLRALDPDSAPPSRELEGHA